MSRVFISYRRKDSSTMTGRIYDNLESALGANKVFRDIDDIGPGEDFRAKLAKEIDKSDIVLIIIGHEWVNIRDENGNGRLDNPNDYVRLEVESSLKRTDKIVIPVLVEGTPMPDPTSLPEDMRELCYRNAVSVRQDPDFHRDIQKLIKQIQEITKESTPIYRRKSTLLAAGILVLGIAAVFLGRSLLSPAGTTVASTTTAAIVTNTVTMQSTATSTEQVIPADTATSVPVTETYTPVPPAHPIRIGVIQIPDYLFQDVRERLQSLGFDAEWIGISADYSVFSEYDVIYLPVGWSFQNVLIEGRSTQYQRFVENGGGLIVEQPNYNGALTPELLPYKITFRKLQYDPNEAPPRILNQHEIANNVPVGQLPGPGNQITIGDDAWTIVTTSAKSNYPTLVIANYGNGRIAVLATSASNNNLIRYQLGDDFIKNLIKWVRP